MSKKNRSLKARQERHRRRGKFKNWRNNPKGGQQAALKPYSMRTWTGPSRDIIMFDGMTIGARNKYAQNVITRDKAGNLVPVPIPPTKGLAFGRVINPKEGPLPRLVVRDKLNNMIAVTRKNEVVMLDRLQQSTYRQWIEQFNHINIFTHGNHHVDVCFSGNTYVLLETQGNVARVSLPYRNFHQAKRRFEQEMVRWAETVTFNDPPSP